MAKIKTKSHLTSKSSIDMFGLVFVAMRPFVAEMWQIQ